MRDSLTCPNCHTDDHLAGEPDTDLLRKQLETNSPLAPHENPAADLG
jgi:hypothetical protein